MVEEEEVKAFVLEGDYGGCEQVNCYIHGGEGSAQEAAAAIGFAVYRTKEMAELISYMRDINDRAAEGEDLRFYGSDMQRIAYSFLFLNDSCEELGIEVKALEDLIDGEEWNSVVDISTRIEILNEVKLELTNHNATDQAIHYADMLIQNCEIQLVSSNETSPYRDQLMAENVQWILRQEQRLGHNRIFVSGHNAHVAKWGSFDSMGKLLYKEYNQAYYVIGTGFYRTQCNLPIRNSKKRSNQVFYSHDPLAKAAKLAGIDLCWLDFSIIPKDSNLFKVSSDYNYMGTLGRKLFYLDASAPAKLSDFSTTICAI